MRGQRNRLGWNSGISRGPISGKKRHGWYLTTVRGDTGFKYQSDHLSREQLFEMKGLTCRGLCRPVSRGGCGCSSLWVVGSWACEESSEDCRHFIDRAAMHHKTSECTGALPCITISTAPAGHGRLCQWHVVVGVNLNTFRMGRCCFALGQPRHAQTH